MVRRWFFGVSAALLIGVGVAALVWPPALWSLIVLAPLIGLGLHDALQRRRTILRNFPLIGHFRFIFEDVRPEIQQYFIESNIDAFPIEREFRALVYQRSKGELETQPFGTQRDVYRVGYEWASHAAAPTEPLHDPPRVTIGAETCRQPYDASLLNISAMSYGALSKNAVMALNRGAAKGGFAHNTGEGAVSPYHEEGGGDLIWQIGTGYFGARTEDGGFDPDIFAAQAARDQVKMVEIKLSQGAKPGHGGVLPGKKVTPEIARIRGVPVWETVFSPPGHSAFVTPAELIDFLADLREMCGGKPVGIKLCIGRPEEFLAICKAMTESGKTMDFISVDGGEGGTGAAPLEFSNSIGMPARDALVFAHSVLRGAGLRDKVRVIASGKILTGFHMVRAMALGADICASARGFMLSLGCIQALRCNTDHCPTGVATQNPALTKGLVVTDKSERVYRYHKATVEACLELVSAMGLSHPDHLRPHHIFRRVADMRVQHFGDLYDILEPGELLSGEASQERLQATWNAARPDRWHDDG